jgi:hypothetical protein
MSVPTLLYWIEDCTLLKIHERQSETGRMVFLRMGAKYIRLYDYKTNAEILELYIYNLNEIIADYKRELTHLLDMKDKRISNHSDRQKKRR